MRNNTKWGKVLIKKDTRKRGHGQPCKKCDTAACPKCCSPREEGDHLTTSNRRRRRHKEDFVGAGDWGLVQVYSVQGKHHHLKHELKCKMQVVWKNCLTGCAVCKFACHIMM